MRFPPDATALANLRSIAEGHVATMQAVLDVWGYPPNWYANNFLGLLVPPGVRGKGHDDADRNLVKPAGVGGLSPSNPRKKLDGIT